jgi:outer membrane protein assembly factor BamA
MVWGLFAGAISAYGVGDTLKYEVKLHLGKKSGADPGKLLPRQKEWVDSAGIQPLAHEILTRLQLAGFGDATFDSLSITSRRVNLYFTPGTAFRWMGIDPGNVEPAALAHAGFREKIYRRRTLSSGDMRRLYRGIVGYYENKGFPFASVRFDSLHIAENRLCGRLKIERGKLVRVDSVVIRGSARITEQYIANYISVKEGDLYNEQRIQAVRTRLMELPFVLMEREPEVEFDQKETRLYLYLNHKKANDFQGILGIQPDSAGNTSVTGDVSLKLQNAMGNGETIDLNWRRMQTQTQDLKARVQYPFVFNLPVGIDASLHIYRRDTTFSTLSTHLGLQYLLRGGDYLKVFYEYEQSAIISTAGMENLTVLPDVADMRTSSWGTGGKTTRLDYRLNPRKGYYAEGEFSFGQREILKNARLNSLVYDSLKLKTQRYKGRGELRGFVPVWGRSTVMTGIKGGYIVNERLFFNELFRIGGMRILRGFDEESIFASSYFVGTLEYRYLLEKNAYFHVFFDGAWYENAAATQLITDTPYGFGSGVSFETKIGVFALSYALGKQFNNPILLRTGKIHFGFVNYF